MDSTNQITLRFFGCVEAIKSCGHKIDVAGIRARALLGILALAGRRGKDRPSLQNLLWPEKPAIQAQDSLRQEIRRLRQLIGIEDFLKINGNHIALNETRVILDLSPPLNAFEAEFLAGVDVPGPFEDWLRDARSWLENRPDKQKHAKDLRIRIESSGVPGDGPIILDRVARGIAEFAPVSMFQGNLGHTDLLVGLTSFDQDDEILLSNTVFRTDNNSRIWGGEWTVPKRDLQNTVSLQASYQIQEAILDAITKLDDPNQAAIIGALALKDTFSLEPSKTAQAIASFKHAYELSDHPTFLAWQAFLITNRVIERHDPDVQSASEQAICLVWEALSAAPDNSTILSIAAHVLRIMDNAPQLAADFGQEALRLNPSNPLAWSSTANAMMSLGSTHAALPLAHNALAITRRSHFRFWWEMNACVACVLSGETSRGIFHAELAHRLKPQFRPPLRYLAALHLAEQNHDQAMISTQKLRALEPDFEPNLIHEPDYPLGTFRQSEIYQSIRHTSI